MGAGKELANTASGWANMLNAPINAVLSTFTTFQFEKAEGLQASTAGEKTAMTTVFAASFLVGNGGAKGATLAANKAMGKAAEAAVASELKAEGATILGSRVSAKTSAGARRVIDHLVEKSGQIGAVEVKAGGATRNAAQIAKDNAMASGGATLVGKNAPAGLRGQTLRIETEVRKPRVLP